MSRRMLTLISLSLFLSIDYAFVHGDAPENVGVVQVELIEPGALPRNEIRFRPEQGAKQSSVIIVKTQQSMTVAGNKLPGQDIPHQRIAMEIEVDDVSSDGDISYSFKYTDFDIVDDPNQPSPLESMLRETLKPMIGTTGSVIVTNRGFTKKFHMNLPDGLAGPVKQMLEGMKGTLHQLSPPVPEQPLGLGAKWRVTEDVSSNGLKMTQVSVNELIRLDRDGFDLRVTVSQQAKPQEIKNPSLPAGTTITLDSLASDGDGTSTFRVNSILPRKSNFKVHTVMDMNIVAAGQNQKTSTEITTEVSFSDAAEQAKE